MPLTFAHPAAVLPLFRTPLVPLALVAGSVSPDVPYFLRSAGVTPGAQSWYATFVNATTTHSPAGAVTVTLAYAVIVYLALLAAVPPARTVLPQDGRLHPRPRAVAGWNRVAWVAVSLLLGIATHVLWDGLIDVGGRVAQLVPALQGAVVGPFSAGRALQHASTVLGLLVLAVWGWVQRERVVPPRGTGARARLVRVAGAVALGAAVAALVSLLGRTEPAGTLALALFRLATGAGVGAAAVTALLVAGWWWRRAVTPRQQRGATNPSDPV